MQVNLFECFQIEIKHFNTVALRISELQLMYRSS